MAEEWKSSISPDSRQSSQHEEYPTSEVSTNTIEHPKRDKKRTRLRQACDACRLRKVRIPRLPRKRRMFPPNFTCPFLSLFKALIPIETHKKSKSSAQNANLPTTSKVKCDEGGPPCRACASQGLLCAYTRMRKKPGPPIRRALPRVSSTTDYTQPFHHHQPPSSDLNVRHSDESVPRLGESSMTGHSSTSVSPVTQSLRNTTFSGAQNYANPISPLNLRSEGSPVKLMSKPIILPQLEFHTDYFLPRDALEMLLDDYFTYIYPLIPLPHEASFWEDFRGYRDKVDCQFLSLIYSMCCATIISFPRRIQSYSSQYYPTARSMLERAHTLAITTRPIDYRDRLNSNLAASVYLLALACGYANIRPRASMHLQEMFFVAKAMLFNQQNLISSEDLQADLVEYELRKRMFWLTFTGERSIYSLLGPSAPNFILDYRPEEIVALQVSRWPKELDDDFITQTSFHEGEMPFRVSVITGMNANTKLHIIYARYLAATAERDKVSTWRISEPELKFRVLKSYIAEMRTALDWLPAELQLNLRLDLGDHPSPSRIPVPGPETEGDPYSNMMDYMDLCPPEPPIPANVILISTPMSNASQDPVIERRRKQFEVMKANLYISQLSLHSVLVSHYSRVARTHRHSIELLGSLPDQWESEVEIDVHKEMDYICRAMLAVSHRVGFEHMQPNGQSLILKIRGIAASLLEEVRAAEDPIGKSVGQNSFRDGSVQAKIHEYLLAFLQILTKLAGENDAADGGWLKGLRNEQVRLNEDD